MDFLKVQAILAIHIRIKRDNRLADLSDWIMEHFIVLGFLQVLFSLFYLLARGIFPGSFVFYLFEMGLGGRGVLPSAESLPKCLQQLGGRS